MTMVVFVGKDILAYFCTEVAERSFTSYYTLYYLLYRYDFSVNYKI